jgi:hypothetical protein
LTDDSGDPDWPRKRGLPSLGTTLDLCGLTSRLVSTAIAGTAGSVQYAPAEGETATDLSASTSDNAVELAGYDADDEEDVADDAALEVED